MGAQQNSYQIGLISKHKHNNLAKLVIEIILILISRINEPPVCAPCLLPPDHGSTWQLGFVSVSQRLSGRDEPS